MRKEEVILEYQNYIDFAPTPPQQLRAEAAQNDDVTINSWRDTWERNVKANHERFGSFADKSIGKFYGKDDMRPVIVAGAGPSLKYNINDLKERGGMTLVSCLHNFHYMEDQGVNPDYYLSLDAGEITIDEVYEGGTKTPDEYWELTKGRKLLCYIGTAPKLLDKWQGEIYFFNAPVPDEKYVKYIDDIELFNTYLSTGGNVLGASLYFARAFLGASIIAFIGADFAFSYGERHFHPWNSKYDEKLGVATRVPSVHGVPVWTWNSYKGFKGWFDHISLTVPGVYYNCTEGGTLGAYKEGNIRSILQVTLKTFIDQMTMYQHIKEQAFDSKTKEKKLLF